MPENANILFILSWESSDNNQYCTENLNTRASLAGVWLTDRESADLSSVSDWVHQRRALCVSQARVALSAAGVGRSVGALFPAVRGAQPHPEQHGRAERRDPTEGERDGAAPAREPGRQEVAWEDWMTHAEMKPKIQICQLNNVWYTLCMDAPWLWD